MYYKGNNMTLVDYQAAKPSDYINGFTMGEISRDYWGMLNNVDRQRSGKIIENFICLPSGALRKRLGTLLLEESTVPMITITWGDRDIVFRSQGSGVEYRVYGDDAALLMDWTSFAGLTYENAKTATVISSTEKTLMLGTKTGVLSIDAPSYIISGKTPAMGTLTPVTDWTNSGIFYNSLIVVEQEKITVSQAGKLFDFGPAGAQPDPTLDGFQETFDRFVNSGERITNVATGRGSFVITTDAAVYTLQPDTVAGTAVYSLRLESSQGVAPGCAVFYGSDFFFVNESGLYWIDEYNLSRDSGRITSSASAEGQSGSVYMISAFCSHVFDKRHIKLTYRRDKSLRILYSLREDGVVINFSILPYLITGTRVPLIAVTRRTCEGEYSWMPTGGLGTLISQRYSETAGLQNFVEQEVFLRWKLDNQAEPVPSAEPNYGENHIYYDCGRSVNQGIWEYAPAAKTENGYILSGKTKVSVGDYVEFDSRETVELTSVVDKPYGRQLLGDVFPGADSEGIFITGKAGVDLPLEWWTRIREYGSVYKTFVSEGTYYREEIAGDSDLTSSGIRVAGGLDYEASIRLLHASDAGRETQRTRARILTVDTTQISVNQVIYTTDRKRMVLAEETALDVQTGFWYVDLRSADSDRLSLPDFEIRAQKGFPCNVLSIGFEIAVSHNKDY